MGVKKEKGQTQSYPETVTKFIENLYSLKRGEIAELRRKAGDTIAESQKCLGIFYRILPPEIVGGRDEELYFLVATLYGLNEFKLTHNFGATMRNVKVKSKSKSKNIDHRMLILLDSQFDIRDGFKPGGGEMAYRLRQCMKIAAGHQVGVDWMQLLTDLTRWSWPERKPQKQWAYSFFGNPIPIYESDTDNETKEDKTDVN